MNQRQISGLFILLSGLVLFLSGCTGSAGAALEKTDIQVGGHPFRVEIADSPAERERGFMERKRIGENEGMLFVFPGDKRLSFWMENTPSPLSIAYIDSTGTIREIYDMEPFSRKPVSSLVSVRYALEVPAGRFEQLGIRPGDRVVFPGGSFPSTRE